ncbi:NAD-dependent epimerase/dehydratase family protein, partial [uncultured Thiohalocapsa sp.]|uniref:NAD-dependent epimerase/dehydratase family protein n=1 Tax=uncultured Thiohalocapsa sp. TaxID=768990 RepID=UPI0025D1970C
MSKAGGAHYLVTGAGGFVGTALCRRLRADGHRVRALLRQPADGPWDERLTCDLGTDPLPVGLMDGIDGVFHLAGIAHVQDVAGISDAVYKQVNVAGTAALLDAAVTAGVRGFVYFSSIKAAAEPGERCVDETWDAWPADAYGRSKREAEALVLRAGREQGLHVCNLRPCLVYGPGVKGNLARLIEAVDRGRFPPLPELGNRRSMVGLDDLI